MNGFFSGKEKNIYRLVNTVLLAGAVMFLFGKAVGIHEPQNLHLVTGVLAAFATSVFFEFYDKRKIISIAGLGILVWQTVVISGKETALLFLQSYAKWFAGISGWEADWWNGYQVLQTGLLVVVIYVLQRLLDRYFWMRVLPAGLMAAGMIYIMAFQIEVPYPGVVCSVCYMMLILMEWTQKNWKKKRSKSMEQYMLWFAPFVAVFFIVLLILPISDKPYEWKYVKAAYRYMEDKIHYLVKEITQGEDDYNMALSGFSGENRLRGSVGESKELVMTLKSERAMRTNVYLVGKVYNHFEADGWKAEQEESLADRYIDTVQTASAAALFGEEALNNYVLETDLEICYENIATDYVFAPMKTYRLVEKNRLIGAESGTGSLHFSKKKRYGSKFITGYFQLNRGDPVFWKLLETEIVYDKMKEDQRVAKMKLLSDTKITQKEIEEYQKRCYENYAEKPVLSPELKTYVDEVTKDAKTGVQRLQAIEEELSTYEYNLSAGNLPDKVVDAGSFLDYFLLESRRGYCTHYATAFILLARAEGYPARYVEGYCVPMAGKKQMDVTSDMAHGWPEVYFDDIGWISFEPTPGTGQLCHISWKTKDAPGKTYEMNSQEYYNRYGMSEEELVSEEVKEAERRAQVQKAGMIAKKALVSLLLGAVVVFLVLVVAMRMVQRSWSEQQRYFYKVKRNLWLLKKLGMKMEESETLAEYAERIKESVPETINLEFVEAYEEVIYAGREIEGELMHRVEEEEKKLWRAVRKKYGRGFRRV